MIFKLTLDSMLYIFKRINLLFSMQLQLKQLLNFYITSNFNIIDYKCYGIYNQ